ncbi:MULTISPECIES: hypothetical protein [Steroidobacteraceae]|nr:MULTISPECIES: hypothetical protein [Steroidobacteraceae]
MTYSQDLEPAAARVSTALRKLATAASGHLGSDCYIHAELGRVLLADCGFQALRVVGFAAWRVGEGNGDVIAHAPYVKGYLPAGVKGFAYHAWLDCSGFIVDFTTYQLRHKAQELDAMDGGHTTVNWCPAFLLLPKNSIRSYKEVAATLHPGVAYYEARPELERALRTQFTLDPQDVHAARVILANPGMTVLGPNGMARRIDQ